MMRTKKTIFAYVYIILLITTSISTLANQPVIISIDKDNTIITQSCTIKAGKYTIQDSDNNGVIQVGADNITIEFARDALLVGSKTAQVADSYTGIGIRINGHTGVNIKNATITGFKSAIYATNADNLNITGVNVTENYSQHLKSTAQAEDNADWLWPHRNDNNEWLTNYGGAIYIEDSSNIIIKNTTVRKSQNGIVLDNVQNSKIYDNDCSFLSGWGLAMWRSSHNVISRNAFDFCVRGYKHKVYNRGQDSAGILMFEQCNENIIAENSVTHGGDGIFGFAGLDAMGEDWYNNEIERLRNETGKIDVENLVTIPDNIIQQCKNKGNNNNLIINNDLSDAVAHGLEMTFSFGNHIIGNNLSGNAICGIWGGYSQGTLITGNTFENNGDMPYGEENGGINIEHGYANIIQNNTFKNNTKGIYLWWDDDTFLLLKPWAKANEKGSANNTISNNTFDGNKIDIQLRKTANTIISENRKSNDEKLIIDTDDDSNINENLPTIVNEESKPEYPVYGKNKPIGARTDMKGRYKITLTEWGPWDHKSALMLEYSMGSKEHIYELSHSSPITAMSLVFPPSNYDRKMLWHNSGGITWSKKAGDSQFITITGPNQDGLYPYKLVFHTAEGKHVISGQFTLTTWDVKVFPWTVDPRENIEGWYAEANGPDAVTTQTSGNLSLKYASGGPSDISLGTNVKNAQLPKDHFGTIASTTIPLIPGKYRITTSSDDGIRVTVDGERLIDNWTWHGPTKDTNEFEITEDKNVTILVEHFEIDGYAILEFEITPFGMIEGM